MIPFHSSEYNATYVKFIALNAAGATAILFLLKFFNAPPALNLAAIPIILSGWLFGQRFVWYSVIFLLTCNGLYFYVNDLDQFTSPKSLIFGTITYALLASTGFTLRFVRDLYIKINQLNEVINKKNRELQIAAFKDPLTDLHNRRYVQEVAVEQINVFLQQLTMPEFARRDLNIENKVLFIMIADIDDFKKINDSHGHITGDEVLSHVAKRIRESVRFDDTVVRWGGEEFLIICPMMNKDAAELVMQKVLDGVRNTSIRLTGGADFAVSISIGAIWMPVIQGFPHMVSFEKSIMIADKALYDVKANGRSHGRLAVFHSDKSIPENLFAPEISNELYKNPHYCEIRVVGRQ
jgi:diguanylate cyclase (GGDEF)-like protein